MSFKAESDDVRSSLSYKLRRVLKFKAKAVLSTDPYVSEETDDTLLPLEAVLEKADILVIATPHPEYRELRTEKPVADVWNILGNGVLV
jgi:UDP-N-acetyl-D-mannosaminuronic acid dehydrogenase